MTGISGEAKMNAAWRIRVLAPAFWAGSVVFACAGGFTPPTGCTGFLTVQSKGCQVTTYMRCDGAEGLVWGVSFNEAGPLAMQLYDREFQWLDGLYAFDGTHETLADPGPDPVSMSTLLEQGEDTFRFTLESITEGETEMLEVTGRDRLTGREVTIDGQTLLETDTTMTIRGSDGAVSYQTSGSQYVSPEMRLFFLGKERAGKDGDAVIFDNSPIDFIFPGEPGFDARRPLYECNSVTSDIGLPDAAARG